MLSLANDGRYPSVALPPEQRRQRTLGALLAQAEALARQSPVLMIFGDAHWSDPTTLELLDLVLRRVMQRPVLVLITFRPEFAVPWTGQSRVTTLTLSRLDRRDGAALVRRVAGNDRLANDVVDAIVERTDGVPLFVEELSKALLESDATVGTASGAEWLIMIPATLQASLMPRLDRLPYGKNVAQIGAAIGRVFPHALLAEVCNVAEAQLGQGLRELLAAGLVNVRGIPPDAEYTFKHALVQDAAYQSMLKSRRAHLHARIADVLESSFPELVEAQRETLAPTSRRRRLLREPSHTVWPLNGGRTRWALRKAIAHLNTGISNTGIGLLAEVPDETARMALELDLQYALGLAYAAPKPRRHRR